MKKRFFAILLAGVLLSACGTNNQSTDVENASELKTENSEIITENSEITTQMPQYSVEIATTDENESLRQAEKQADELKKQYGDKLFVSYDTAYAVGFLDEEWGGVEEDTMTNFEKNNMKITSVHLDEVDLPVFGDVRSAIPQTMEQLQNQYTSNESTEDYVVKKFDFTDGEYRSDFAVVEINEEEYTYLITRTIAAENNAFLISGYCNTEEEMEEITDIILNHYYIF